MIISSSNWGNYINKYNLKEESFELNNLQISYDTDSILFDGFYYNWYAIINDNPLGFVNGIENYTYESNNIFKCNETTIFGTGDPYYEERNVNNKTRLYDTSLIWGNGKYDWVWIFRNTTFNTKNIPIATFEGGTPEEEHLFNVTGESFINLYDSLYDVWVLEDDRGSIAYYEKNTGILIKGFFYFAGSNTWEINMTETNVIFPSNINTPQLKNPNLNLMIGNLTTNFRFIVNYSDADNNIPTSINVVINNTAYRMTKQDLGDTNYTNGVLYEYQTFLKYGTYNYFFNASDGVFSTSTSTFSGPKVYYNNSYSPILNQGTVDPQLGYNATTEFLFRVNYSDTDNNPPEYINVEINNTVYSMIKEDESDLNYMDGTFFRYPIILNDTGYYIFNFTAFDGINTVYLPGTGFYHNPNVTRHDLNDINIGWIVTHGEDSNTSYSTFLNDALGLGATSSQFHKDISPSTLYPYELLMLEEGGDAWSKQELINLHYWIENGGALLIIGDNLGNAQLSVSNYFNISYSSLSGTIGSSAQIYHPHYLTVEINNLFFDNSIASINISNSNSNLQIIANASNGRAQICLLELGMGKILWIVDEILDNTQISSANNRLFGLNVLRWMSENKVNNFIPDLSSANVDPIEGNTTTFFNFSVIYTDQDNNGPMNISLNINGNIYQMEKQDPLDFDYKDGVVFKTITTLQNGTYYYFINASDGENNISTSVLVGPNVNYNNINPPELTFGMVLPIEGYEHQFFTFQVNYSDKDNNAPKYLNITIDGNSYEMYKIDPLDDYYLDGVIYEYKTLLDIGSHLYFFNTSDGVFDSSTIMFFGPLVNSSPLKDMRIGWITAHGENSYTLYHNDLINDAIHMGAEVAIISSSINNIILQDLDIIVVNDGGVSWATNELDYLEDWIINGHSVLILGDNRDNSQVSVSSRFKVYYSSQSGYGGNSTQIYHPHDITNGVSEVNFPYPTCSISSSSNIYLTPIINDTSGNYNYVSYLQYGSGKLLWITDDSFSDLYLNRADNNLLANNTWKWLANTALNQNAPNITKVEVIPSTGYSNTQFRFYLYYSDLDGSAPIEVSIVLNGTSYQMKRQDVFNENYMDSVTYKFSITLSAGTYNYYFNITDGKYNTSHPLGELQLIVKEKTNGGDNTLIIILGITIPIGIIAVAVIVILIKRRNVI